MKGWLRDHSLSAAYVVLLVVSLGAAAHTGWVTYAREQSQHGQPATLRDFAPEFAWGVFGSLPDEWLALLGGTILGAHLRHKGSPESK